MKGEAAPIYVRRDGLLVAIGLVSALCWTPSAAWACSMIRFEEPSPAEKGREARLHIEGAAAIVDGEVVRPWREGQPALVRAFRILKGPRLEFFQIGVNDSCDHALEQKGERLRMILSGGPEIYFLSIDYSLSRYEDRLLRSDRRKMWPIREGESP
jgi:hypothetical protein